MVETTATRDAVMAANVHPNYSLDLSVAEVTFPAAPGSLGRNERAASLIETAVPTMTGAVAILADHEAHPQSICVHPDPAEGDEGSTILFAMVAEPAALAHDRVRPRLQGHVRDVPPRRRPLIVRPERRRYGALHESGLHGCAMCGPLIPRILASTDAGSGFGR